MSLSSFILVVVALHLGIVGIVIAVKYAGDPRNRLRLNIPDSGDVFIGYPNYSVDEGSPSGSD